MSTMDSDTFAAFKSVGNPEDKASASAQALSKPGCDIAVPSLIIKAFGH